MEMDKEEFMAIGFLTPEPMVWKCPDCPKEIDHCDNCDKTFEMLPYVEISCGKTKHICQDCFNKFDKLMEDD